jgi:DNA-directed RNA polymerase subunit beta
VPDRDPEGPNIGLIGSLASYAQVNRSASSRRRTARWSKGKVTDEIDYLTATEEERYVIAQANAARSRTAQVPQRPGAGAPAGGEVDYVSPEQVDYMDVSPKQIVSVATALIPFLEHDDANRALMGSNMQRQAVPAAARRGAAGRHRRGGRAAIDSGDMVIAPRPARSSRSPATRSSSRRGQQDRRVPAQEVRALQPGHLHQPEAAGPRGRQGQGGRRRARRRSVDRPRRAGTRQEPAGGLHAVGGPQLRGRHHPLERLVKDDVLTSIHIEEYEIEARDTKLGAEEITRDIPNVAEEVLADLDEDGIIRIGAEVGPGDYLVGKVTPKGETELTPRSACCGPSSARRPARCATCRSRCRTASQGKVIDVKVFRRDDGDELPPGVNELVRVYVAQQRKISEGDKLAGRHGNKGVIAKILPESRTCRSSPTARRSTSSCPARRAVPHEPRPGARDPPRLGGAQGWSPFEGDDSVEGKGAEPWTNVATPVFDGATEDEIAKVLANALPNRDGCGWSTTRARRSALRRPHR